MYNILSVCVCVWTNVHRGLVTGITDSYELPDMDAGNRAFIFLEKWYMIFKVLFQSDKFLW